MNVLYAREVIMLPLINLWNFMAHNCWALGKNRLLYILFVDAIFCPVTWHHQRRPFVRVLACKTAKTRRGLAGEASPTVKSVKCLKKGERERERERESGKRFFQIVLILHFIFMYAICLFCPCQAQDSMWTSDIFSDLI